MGRFRQQPANLDASVIFQQDDWRYREMPASQQEANELRLEAYRARLRNHLHHGAVVKDQVISQVPRYTKPEEPCQNQRKVLSLKKRRATRR